MHRPSNAARLSPRAAKAVFWRNEASFSGEALEAVLAAARRPPGNEDSRTDRSSSLGGLRRSFVTMTLFGGRDDSLRPARDFRHKSGRLACAAVAFALRHRCVCAFFSGDPEVRPNTRRRKPVRSDSSFPRSANSPDAHATCPEISRTCRRFCAQLPGL